MDFHFIEGATQQQSYRTPRKRYGFWKFMGDIIMVALTSGLWLIWIFVREMRRR